MSWLIHIFTASGLLAGFMSITAINARDWRTAMAWLLVALFIDGVDGTLARIFKVSEKLPHINGKMIDTVVDFTNYAVVPAYFFYVAGLAGPTWSLPLALLILLVSAVYYGKEGMISEDFYFIGFPVMWNVVIFYLVFVFDSALSTQTSGLDPASGLKPQTSGLEIPSGLSTQASGLNAATILIFSILHFVPVKFAYPSRATRNKTLTIAATVSIMVLMPLIVWFYPEVPLWLRIAAIINLAYFGVLAVFDTLRGRN